MNRDQSAQQPDEMRLIEDVRREIRLEIAELREELVSIRREYSATIVDVRETLASIRREHAAAIAEVRKEIVTVRRGSDAAIDAVADQLTIFTTGMYREMRAMKKDIADIWDAIREGRVVAESNRGRGA